jgi:hypothetical protein
VAPRIPTREESVVAGRVEMVKVDIELDLYSFGPSPAPKEAAP